MAFTATLISVILFCQRVTVKGNPPPFKGGMTLGKDKKEF